MGRIIPYIMENKTCSKPPTKWESIREKPTPNLADLEKKRPAGDGHVANKSFIKVHSFSKKPSTLYSISVLYINIQPWLPYFLSKNVYRSINLSIHPFIYIIVIPEKYEKTTNDMPSSKLR